MRRLAVLAAFALLQALAPAQHDHAAPHRHARRFAFVDESQHGAEPGELVLESAATWARGSRAEPELDGIGFEHELEYGLGDAAVLEVLLAEWHTTDERGEWDTRHDASGVGLGLRLAHPGTDLVGLGLRTELAIGSRELAWANALVVDKTLGAWHLACNLEVDAAWPGDGGFRFRSRDREVAVTQALGASRELAPSLFAGAELLHELPPRWDPGERTNLFAGPCAAWHGGSFAITTAALFLADGDDDAPRFQLRVLFEFHF